jgi:multidrug resistance efflux pump
VQEQNVIENMKNIRKNKNSENEIAVTGKSGIFWLKGLAGLLAVMLVFTIASRVVASITVPQVTASAPSPGKIEHTVMASGTVEAGGEKAIVTEEGILVAQVNVHTGESIGEGETLFALDMDSLEDQIYELQNQIKKLQLENDSLKKNKAQADAKQQLELKRAQEDYEETIAKNTVSDGKANEALQKAADAKSQAEKELNSAKDALAQAEKELNAVKEELQNVKDAAAAEQSKNTADQTGEAEKKDTNSTITQKLQQLEEAVQEKQNTYDTIQAKVTEKQAALDSASVALEEKQEQLESNTSTAEDAKKAAERAVEDAGLSADIDHTQEINAISLEQFQKQLEKLKTLKQQNGEITAPSSGIITKVCVETGQKTTDTAAVVMSDEQSGLFFTTTTDSKNREYLSVGDNATITGVGKETSDCSIVSLETSKDGSSIKVLIAMQGDDFLPGESAQMTATRKSESYDYLVPVTAVWQENSKAYVLLLETENTVLGEQYIARKAEVQILDKNSSYAAVSGNSLSADCQIITDSDRTVGNGDVVRMTE